MKDKPFTVIGFYPDTGQRYMTQVLAPTGDAAEQAVLGQHPYTPLALVGVIAGHHHAADSEPYIQESTAVGEGVWDGTERLVTQTVSGLRQ